MNNRKGRKEVPNTGTKQTVGAFSLPEHKSLPHFHLQQNEIWSQLRRFQRIEYIAYCFFISFHLLLFLPLPRNGWDERSNSSDSFEICFCCIINWIHGFVCGVRASHGTIEVGQESWDNWRTVPLPASTVCVRVSTSIQFRFRLHHKWTPLMSLRLFGFGPLGWRNKNSFETEIVIFGSELDRKWRFIFYILFCCSTAPRVN